MASADHDIRARIEAFAADLGALVKRAAVDAVQAALGSPPAPPAAPSAPSRARVTRRSTPRAKAAPPAAPRAARPARPAATRGRKARAAKPAPAAPRQAAGRATGRKPAPRKRVPGQKRASGEIQVLIDRLARYVADHPGATMGTIKDALSTPRNDLVVPAKKLIAAGKIRAEGKKQFTKYFPL